MPEPTPQATPPAQPAKGPLNPDPRAPKIFTIVDPATKAERSLVLLTDQIWEPKVYIDLMNLFYTRKPQDFVQIVIDSPGGNVVGGQSIVPAMIECKCPIQTVAAGWVASMAAIIWAIPADFVALPGARPMFHQTTHGDIDKTYAIRDWADVLIKYQEEFYQAIVAKGLLTEEEFIRMTKQKLDIFLQPEEAMARCQAAQQKRQAATAQGGAK